MPQQLLLEGPDLEALLMRARNEYGAGVTVVRAEKVRTGGFLGFFTREHFELTLEVPDAEPTQAPATTGPRADAIDRALAAEIADAQAAREALFAEAAPREAREQAEAPAEASSVSAAAERDRHEDQPAATPAAATTARTVPDSTDMAEFDRLVLQLTESATVESTPVEAAPPARAFVKASFPPAPPSTPRRGSTGSGEASETHEPASSPLNDSVALAPSDPADGAGARVRDPREPEQDAGVVLNRWGVFNDVAAAVSTRCTVPALLALGVPRRFTREFEDLNAPIPLLDVVARFGVPPVKRPEPGDLVVIAGPADQAVAVATQVAAWLGMPATAVALAGEIAAIRGHGRRIRNQAEAASARRRADKAARLGEPLIVAFGVAPGRRGAATAAPMLAAFEADTTWAVVDATKRAAVTEPGIKLLALDGRVDAIAAIGLADAQAPAAVLDSSLPIAWMDGLPAASVVWAALLGERIADADEA